jgi:hypothetical protein
LKRINFNFQYSVILKVDFSFIKNVSARYLRNVMNADNRALITNPRQTGNFKEDI